MYPNYLSEYIPSSFDIEKYQDAANIPLSSWIVNLTSRALSYIASEERVESLTESEREFLEGLNLNNLIHGVVDDERFGLILNDLSMMDKAEDISVLRELTYYDLFSLADALKTKELEELYQDSEASVFPILNEKKLGKLNQAIRFNEILEEENFSLLQVDLNASDSEIKSAFSGWLKRERERQESDKNTKRREFRLKNLNQVAFRKWYDARVLAYFDLVTWNNLQGNTVTSKIAGEILFPEPENPRDTTAMINDTVKPLAQKLSDITTLRRMTRVLSDQNRKKITSKTS